VIEVSDAGASLVVNDAVLPGSTVSYTVLGADVHGAGRVVSVRPTSTPIGTLYTLGVRDDRPAGWSDGAPLPVPAGIDGTSAA
jgi:hypothetical protein